MAKARSPKLRTLITLYALFKHTDEKHRLNSVKLNEFLRPYGLTCNRNVIVNTAEKLNEAGIAVDFAGGGPYQGICFSNRPLPDHELKRLIYAIDTNPNLTKTQAQALLDTLRSCVTEYQEPMLHPSVESENTFLFGDDSIQVKFSLIHKAISQKHRVCFSQIYCRVDKTEKTLMQKQTSIKSFLPRYLIPVDGSFYMVGYNFARQKVEAINLNDVVNLCLAKNNILQKMSEILQMLDSIDPCSYLSKEDPVIYEGSAVFYCRAKHLLLLYDRFGAPNDAVARDGRYRMTYPVSCATITSETLQWLRTLPDRGIRIIGPDSLLHAIERYYHECASNLLGVNTSAQRR